MPFTDHLKFSTSQYIGGISVILGLGSLVSLVRRYRRDPDSSRLWLIAGAGHGGRPGRPARTAAAIAPPTSGASGVEHAGRTAAIALLLAGFGTSAARAAEAPATVNAPVTAAPTATPSDAAPKPAETQAAAAQRAAQEAEAQVIELRRQLDALERQRAGYDDVRRRLDQLDARQRESDRQAAAGDANPPETSVVRFRDDGLEIRSPDNGFYSAPDGARAGDLHRRARQPGPQDPAPPDLSGFSLGRAEMILEGHVGGPFFQYRLQLDAAESPLAEGRLRRLAPCCGC